MLFEYLNIISKIKKGDKQSFKILFDQFYDALCRFSYLIIKDKFIAEDVVQNVFIKIWEIKIKSRLILQLNLTYILRLKIH
ncbi:MAG: hypothetical protein JXA68_06800 [Ignavibacteriales bacterium]|nr:hypothetical protein [Ignavibacteriales bacterium]